MKTPAEELDLLGVRFRDAVLHAFTLGKRAGECKFGASVLYQEEYESAVKLWEEVVLFLRSQVAAKQPERNGTPAAQPTVKK